MIHLAAALVLTCTTPGIIDGDTMRCDGERVRLWGIDAPESHTPEGPAATRALADLTRGRRVVCTEVGKRSYGRVVAQCFVGGADLACVMVRRGMAVDWPRFSRGAYARCGR